jgi:hypothetical protein
MVSIFELANSRAVGNPEVIALGPNANIVSYPPNTMIRPH